MGCGKTTVGKLLAQMTGFDFIDTDDYVKELAGMSIHDMLVEGRISDVRKYEHLASSELSERKGAVIATGGGVLAKRENGQAFRKNCSIVFLKRDFDTVYPLISKDPVRVIAYGKSYEELKKLHDERIPLYSEYACLTVENNGSAEDTAAYILEHLSD